MFDSPLALCKECDEYVALDQKRTECAAQHCCEISAPECPLGKYFTGAYGAIPTEPVENSI
ncbi:MAG TPA: hypothetical protein VLA73_03360 [Burkholderiales bacterium]|nr:hypothetical protein [Burkholderiales bacterium]